MKQIPTQDGFMISATSIWPLLLKKRRTHFWLPHQPLLVRRKEAFEAEYRRAQREILYGKEGWLFSLAWGCKYGPAYLGRTKARVKIFAPGVKLEAPCLIGRRSHIAKGALIGAYTVIGQDARIGPGSTLRNCILWDGVTVGKHVRLENCVIGHRAHVSESISMYEGSVIQAT